MDAADAGIPLRVVLPDATLTRRQEVVFGAGCLLLALAPSLLLAALIQGQMAHLGRILLGIVPLAAPFVWIHGSPWRWNRRRAGRGEVEPERSTTADGIPERVWRLAEDGVHASAGSPIPWPDLAGYRLDSEAPAPRILVTYRRSERRRDVPWAAIGILGGLLFGAGFEIVTAAAIVRQRGPGADAALAGCIALMYLFPLGIFCPAWLLDRWPGRPTAKTLRVAFDVDEEHLGAALDLLGRFLPQVEEGVDDGP